jgi:hypothetical protein
MVSHVELFWTLPDYKAFMEQLATFCRVVIFGQGCGGTRQAHTVDPSRGGPYRPDHDPQLGG